MLGGICSSSCGIPSMSGPYSKRGEIRWFRLLSGHDGWGRQLSKRCVQSRKTLDSRLRGNDVGEYGNDGESNLLRPGRIHAAKVNGTVPFTFWT